MNVTRICITVMNSFAAGQVFLCVVGRAVMNCRYEHGSCAGWDAEMLKMQSHWRGMVNARLFSEGFVHPKQEGVDSWLCLPLWGTQLWKALSWWNADLPHITNLLFVFLCFLHISFYSKDAGWNEPWIVTYDCSGAPRSVCIRSYANDTQHQIQWNPVKTVVPV
jgi:hypothetical protein